MKKKRSLFWNWWAILWTWQHILEECYGPLEQMQAHWALHHGLVILTISWAPQAVLCVHSCDEGAHSGSLGWSSCNFSYCSPLCLRSDYHYSFPGRYLSGQQVALQHNQLVPLTPSQYKEAWLRQC